MNWFTQFSCSNRETSVNRSNDTYTVNAYTLVGNHPLHIIAKCEQMKLMEHDYCTRLGTEKFRRFVLVLFSIFAVIYALFVTSEDPCILHGCFYYWKKVFMAMRKLSTMHLKFLLLFCKQRLLYSIHFI